MYELGTDACACVGGTGVYLISRTREPLERARRVLGGQAPNLSQAGQRFTNLRAGRETFLVAAVGAGLPESVKLPKPAEFLRQAEGARLGVGEGGERLLVELVLGTRTSEAATQIQQLLQGLIALAALNPETPPDLQELAKAARVGGGARQVEVKVDLPITNVLARIPTREKSGARADAGRRSASSPNP